MRMLGEVSDSEDGSVTQNLVLIFIKNFPCNS